MFVLLFSYQYPKSALFLLPGKVHPLEGKLCLLLLALQTRTPPLLALLKNTLGQGIHEETSLHRELTHRSLKDDSREHDYGPGAECKVWPCFIT